MTEISITQPYASKPIETGSIAVPAGPPVQIPLWQISNSRSFVIAAAGYLAVLAMIFWRLFTGNILHTGAENMMYPPFINPSEVANAIPFVNEMEGDFTQQFSNFEEYQYRSAREGRFPTWNPYIYMGQPFHADGQSAMLNPFHWIYFVVDPDLARGWMTILRLWISAIALFCLLRKFGLSPSPAFAGGAIWIFCSFNMHWLMWPHTNASLWMPVLILAIDYLMVRRTLRGYAATSLAAGVMFLAGHPGTEYLCGLCIACYVLIRLIMLKVTERQTFRQLLPPFAAVSAAMFTGLLVAAAAILPLLMQIRQSFEYLDPTGARGNKMGTWPWDSLWLFLIPEVFGRARAMGFSFNLPGGENYIEMSLWFGASGVILALTAVLSTFIPTFGRNRLRWRERFAFLPVFGICLFAISLLTVFCINPVYYLAHSLPGSSLTSLRRFFVASHFAGAVLAALALQQILVRRNRVAAFVCAALSIVGSWLVVSMVGRIWDQQQQHWQDALYEMMGQLGPVNLPRLINNLIEQNPAFRTRIGAALLLITTALMICVFVQTIRRREISATLRYLLIAMITFDVMLPAAEWQPIPPARLANPAAPESLESMILAAGDGRMLGMTTVLNNHVSYLLDPNMSMHYGFRDIRGYEFPHNNRLAQLYKRLKIQDRDNRGDLILSMFYPYIQPQIQAYLDKTCVRQIMAVLDPRAAKVLTTLKLSRSQESPGYESWPLTAPPANGIFVFTNPNAYPRTFFAQSAAKAATANDAMDVLLDPDVNQRSYSVYEDSTELPVSTASGDPAADTASITTDKPEQLVIDAQASARKLLILEDRMDIGWQVSIDGKAANPVTANYLFRGVFVPAGHHTIEWTYHAPGLLTGSVLSITSVLGLLILAIFATVKPLFAPKFEEPDSKPAID